MKTNKISDYMFLIGIMFITSIPIIMILSQTFYHKWSIIIFLVISGIASLIGVILIIISMIIKIKGD